MQIIFNFEIMRLSHINTSALGHFRFIMQLFMNIWKVCRHYLSRHTPILCQR